MRSADIRLLVCPETKQPVEQVKRGDPERAPDLLTPATRVGSAATPVGPTPTVLVRRDRRIAYPVVDGVPVMLVPEGLGGNGSDRVVDLRDGRYAEAYDERDYYEQVATREVARILDSPAYLALAAHQREGGHGERFPRPAALWLDATYEATAQWKAYRHLAPLGGKRCLQLGGKGVGLVKMLVAGAAEAWLLTPMVGEARYALALAEALGVDDRLRCVVGVAEELPFDSETFDAVYAAGCAHHMVTELAFPEIARVLRPGGRFAAFDPWRTPFYGAGIRLFGKREAVYCRPLTDARVAPMATAFGWSKVSHHGALTRYPLLLLERMGLWTYPIVVWWIARVDDALTSLVPPVRRLGSAVALLATKA